MHKITKIEKEIAKIIYEGCRLEAKLSQRRIVPEKFENRDLEFKKQFYKTIKNYLSLKKLPTPKQVHDNWVKEYKRMGWKFGIKRDTKKKTHPDLVSFNKLPKDERDKDSIFLTMVWVAKKFIELNNKKNKNYETNKRRSNNSFVY
jgi:hypothetical protein